MTSQESPLRRLADAGVAIWLDDLARERTRSGGLAALAARGVVGVTSNPTIFANALTDGADYADQMADLAAAGATVDDAVFRITTDDVREACDVLRPAYDATDTVDGRVSIEVEPGLAHDTAGTIASARALWAAVGRPNLFVKIPATVEGLPAITAALAGGISINVTLIFSIDRYRGVMDAFFAGMEQAKAAGIDLPTLGSVASFFVSRVDTAVDPRLDALGTPEAARLRGATAVANARLAYAAYQDAFATPRWVALEAAGARPQRPLWASTGVKDKTFPDTKYVDELVVHGVVNTMPEATLDAVDDHGDVHGDTVTGTGPAAAAVIADVERLGISFDEVTAGLESEGVEKFVASWEKLRESVRAGLDAAAKAAR